MDGDPARVNMCSCTECQRRSGSAFQLGAFFDETQIKGIEGESTVYARTGGSGNAIDLHFCPTCGVSVYFRPAARPSVVGVLGGCFADPDFPAPAKSTYTERRHSWLTWGIDPE